MSFLYILKAIFSAKDKANKSPLVCLSCADFGHTGYPTLNKAECSVCKGFASRLRNWLADKLEPDYEHAIRGSVMVRVQRKKD